MNLNWNQIDFSLIVEIYGWTKIKLIILALIFISSGMIYCKDIPKKLRPESAYNQILLGQINDIWLKLVAQELQLWTVVAANAVVIIGGNLLLNSHWWLEQKAKTWCQTGEARLPNVRAPLLQIPKFIKHCFWFQMNCTWIKGWNNYKINKNFKGDLHPLEKMC